MSTEKAKNTTTHQAPAGFEKVVVDMPSFKPDPYTEREGPGSDVLIYKGKPLQGEILGARNFGSMKDDEGKPMTNEDGETKDMVALLVKVEEDVDVIGRDKKPIVAKKGETILWFATTKIRQAILQALRIDAATLEEANTRYVAALNGEYGLRFWCLPLKKEQHPKNASFKIWSYDFRLHPEPVKRVGTSGIARFFQHANAAELGPQVAHAAQNGGTLLPAQS